MDARQFLKEAKEQYSAKEFPPPTGFYHFWEDDVSSLDVFKRSLCRYTDRSGTTINYLFSLLHARTISERFAGTNPDGIWKEEWNDIVAKADEDGRTFRDRWAMEEELLLGIVLDNFDEVTRRLRQMTAEHKAIDAMNAELKKYPNVTCDGNIGDIMRESIGLYKQVMNSRADIETYKEIQKLCDNIHDNKTSLVNMIRDCINASKDLLSDIEKKHGTYETHLHKVLVDNLKGKYIYWDNKDFYCVKYMRIDGVTMKPSGDDKELFMKGPILGFDWGGSPSFAPDSSIFLSYLNKIDKSTEELHIVEFDELCKLVEKYAPFMLDYIKKLAKNEKEKT